jgi:hypothetical protein
MKYILRENQITSSYPSNVLFVKYKLWDNSQTKRKLPFPGASAWAVRKVDLKKLLNFFDDIKTLYPHMGGGSENIEILNPSGKNIVALDYGLANNYVLGDSDEEPVEEKFDPQKHTLKFDLAYQNPWNQRDKHYKPVIKYQVLLQ